MRMTIAIKVVMITRMVIMMMMMRRRRRRMIFIMMISMIRERSMKISIKIMDIKCENEDEKYLKTTKKYKGHLNISDCLARKHNTLWKSHCGSRYFWECRSIERIGLGKTSSRLFMLYLPKI